mmetsp:Transcript_15449/g.27371  ORF Transcript_15449/g.27371 Transcript_15449/m.27371 type:complete len:443 (-) Transcript_15449:590-1918(-)
MLLAQLLKLCFKSRPATLDFSHGTMPPELCLDLDGSILLCVQLVQLLLQLLPLLAGDRHGTVAAVRSLDPNGSLVLFPHLLKLLQDLQPPDFHCLHSAVPPELGLDPQGRLFALQLGPQIHLLPLAFPGVLSLDEPQLFNDDQLLPQVAPFVGIFLVDRGPVMLLRHDQRIHSEDPLRPLVLQAIPDLVPTERGLDLRCRGCHVLALPLVVVACQTPSASCLDLGGRPVLFFPPRHLEPRPKLLPEQLLGLMGVLHDEATPIRFAVQDHVQRCELPTAPLLIENCHELEQRQFQNVAVNALLCHEELPVIALICLHGLRIGHCPIVLLLQVLPAVFNGFVHPGAEVPLVLIQRLNSLGPVVGGALCPTLRCSGLLAHWLQLKNVDPHRLKLPRLVPRVFGKPLWGLNWGLKGLLLLRSFRTMDAALCIHRASSGCEAMPLLD